MNIKLAELKLKGVLFFSVFIFFSPSVVLANGLPDADSDAVPDQDEIGIYFTNPDDPDSDGDGYGDFEEITTGFPPLNKERVKVDQADSDGDGLNDWLEIQFRTDPLNPDTDQDGYRDGDEVKGAFDPKKSEGAKLEKQIEISTKAQELKYFLGGVKLGSFPVSTGKPAMPTPKGEFRIDGKHPKAWSRTYGLWMPFWMSLKNGKFGLHELPVWPSGYREGENHLGKAVSHGCIRLGVGAAETLYKWADMGTRVVIY